MIGISRHKPTLQPHLALTAANAFFGIDRKHNILMESKTESRTDEDEASKVFALPDSDEASSPAQADASEPGA